MDIPRVEKGQLYDATGAPVCAVEVDTKKPTAWQRWLMNPANISFAFEGDAGAYFTGVKEEKRLRSGNRGFYWVAHIRRGGRLFRLAICSINYTHRAGPDQLQALAARLVQQSLAEVPEAGEAMKQATKRQRRRTQYHPPGRLPDARPEPVIGSQGLMFDDPEEDSGRGYYRE